MASRAFWSSNGGRRRVELDDVGRRRQHLRRRQVRLLGRLVDERRRRDALVRVGLACLHRLVGGLIAADRLERDLVEVRPALAEVAGVLLQHELVARAVGDDRERPGADRLLLERPLALLSKVVFDAIQFRFDEMNERSIGRERRGEVELDRVVAGRRDRRILERRPRALRVARARRRERTVEVPLHRLGVERAPSVNFTPGRSLIVNVLPSLGERPALGELADDLAALDELEELAVDRVHVRLVRGAVGVRGRIETRPATTRRTPPPRAP